MNYEIVELKKKTVVGLTARTSNMNEDMPQIIGGLWSKFFSEEGYSCVKNKANKNSIGLYSNYEQGVTGEYDITVCCEVSHAENVDAPLVTRTIPAGKYAKFVVHGHVQQAVAEFWGKLWNMPLDRSFTCDFEEYQSGTDMNNAEIHIYIALNSENLLQTNEAKICQSCGMPMTLENQFGTNVDGSKCEDYCTYCYQNGDFTDARTMEEMIEICIPFELQAGVYQDEKTARNQMNKYFPALKRWQA